ncbi:MAG: hypothetical protein ACRBM6_14480 [Geminicoccales bacterium]
MNNNNNVVSRHHPSLTDRQAAERKLCRFFASFGIDAMLAHERLITPFIKRAEQFWRAHGGADLASLALEEAEIDVTAWFADVLDLAPPHDRTSVVIGRASFLMCGSLERSIDLFLMPVEDLPNDVISAMRRRAPSAVPPSIEGDMHHQPYEAWSVRNVLPKVAPFDKGIAQTFGDLFRRDGRVLSLLGRDSSSTP